MKDYQKIEAIEAELAQLKLELVGIRATLAEVKNLEARQKELIGSAWGGRSHGLIQSLEWKLENEKWPIWRPVTAGHGLSSSRILAVDDKWITTRSDGCTSTTRYNRATGRKERARDDRDNVDVAMMLKIWEDWHQ